MPFKKRSVKGVYVRRMREIPTKNLGTCMSTTVECGRRSAEK